MNGLRLAACVVSFSCATFSAGSPSAGSQPPAGPTTAASYAALARSRLKSGDFEGAANICERGMTDFLNSDEIEVAYLALPAEVLAERLARRFEDARNTRDAKELTALGRVLADMDPLRKTESSRLAEELLERAVALAPHDPSVYYNYGRVLRLRGKPDAMFAAFDRALSLKPDDELKLLIYTRIAKQKSLLSQPEAAASAFQTALHFNRKLLTHNPNAAFEYFLFLRSQSEVAAARTLVAEILLWSPRFLPALAAQARLSAEGQDWNKAIERGEQVLQSDDASPEMLRSTHEVLARAYSATNQPQRAQAHASWVESH